ncbi:helix-turn-helix domain-containing protein [bacterium]|nr:helix-turn-helix domain-containing protein [bacterium]MCB1221258.1 helix-turn-helix domain-containing protein [bacterium]UNM08937.1 MAG: helix-turn-helix domain-containing protein [Planctomycetales bacterium]
MKKEQVVGSLGEARVLLKPLRMDIMHLLAEPHSCTEIAGNLGLTPQKVHYHVKVLEKAGFVEQVDERQARGLKEAIYRVTAQSVSFAPALVAALGGREKLRDNLSVGYMMGLADELARDSNRLAMMRDETPTLNLSAQIELADASQRGEFMAELQQLIQFLAEKYGADDGVPRDGADIFKLVLACYRNPDSTDEGGPSPN